MFGKKFRFSRIPSTDNGDDGEDFESEDKSYQHEHGTSARRWITWPRSLAIISLVVISSIIIILTATRSPKPTWTSCGNDPATARSRGCSFDLLSFAWQTPECFDGDLMAEFASWDGDWNFYSDDQYSTVVSQDIALQGERTPLFVTWQYHIVHCTFMWRQMHRAFEKGWIDSHLSSYNHTLHCQKMTLMGDDEPKKPVMARLIYPECLRVGGWTR